jgi:chromosome partitioning protein
MPAKWLASRYQVTANEGITRDTQQTSFTDDRFVSLTSNQGEQRHSEVTPRAVAFNVLKGGMGKTMLAKNTAMELAYQRHRVLLVDLDDNGHLSRHLGYTDAYETGFHLGDAMQDKYETALEDLIYTTDYGFDFMPSASDTKGFHAWLTSDERESEVHGLKNNLVDPLLEDAYDYILFDTPANRSIETRNAIIAAGNIIIPLKSGTQLDDALNATFSRIVKPLNNRTDSQLRVLAIVPNQVTDRLDHDRPDRRMLEKLNTIEPFDTKVPNFARIPSEIWTAIDNGELHSNPLPGIRESSILDQDKPVRSLDATNPQLKFFVELAEIIQQGEVVRQENIATQIRDQY